MSVAPPVRVLGWLMGLSKHGRKLSATGTRHIVILRQFPATAISDTDGNTVHRPPSLWTWSPCHAMRLTVAPEKDGYPPAKRCKRCLAYADSEHGRSYMDMAVNR